MSPSFPARGLCIDPVQLSTFLPDPLMAPKGTTLEDDFKADISHPLWSSVLLRDNPEVITQAHEEFLRSGADMILTTT